MVIWIVIWFDLNVDFGVFFKFFISLKLEMINSCVKLFFKELNSVFVLLFIYKVILVSIDLLINFLLWVNFNVFWMLFWICMNVFYFVVIFLLFVNILIFGKFCKWIFFMFLLIKLF